MINKDEYLIFTDPHGFDSTSFCKYSAEELAEICILYVSTRL